MAHQLTDKDIAGDILSGFKFNAAGYLHAVMEAQDPSIRQAFLITKTSVLLRRKRSSATCRIKAGTRFR